MNGSTLVVGVDGGAGALGAVRWAARECAADPATLVLLHALGHAAEAEPADTEQVLADAEATARATASGIMIRRRPERGRAADALVAAGASARLIALGTNGVADVAGSMLGTVGHRVATHAVCPVVIVPSEAEADPAGAVVVGLAPGRAGCAALGFALAYAARHGKSVVGVSAGENFDDSSLSPGAEAVLDAWPSVEFSLRRAETDPVSALSALSGDAALLVLGCHHSDEPWSTRLGPVPTALLDRCPVPIALVGRPDR